MKQDKIKYSVPGVSLKCYSDLAGLQWTQCDQRKGFRTCYTKYDPGKGKKHLILIR